MGGPKTAGEGMSYFMPKRYLTERDDEPDAGYFSIGWIQDAKKELIGEMKYADVIAGIKKQKLCFEILVSGKLPPIDELWNTYLVASPPVAKKFKQQFGRQLECIATQAVDEETGESFDMVLLRPVLEARCFIKHQVVKWTKDGGRIEDVITYGSTGFPRTYCLSRPVLGDADIALVKNAPEPFLAISERFRDAILATIPRRARHLKHIEFRNYIVLDERPQSVKSKARKRPVRKASSKRGTRSQRTKTRSKRGASRR